MGGGRLVTLERYWSIHEADVAEVPALVAACFTPGAVFESVALESPLIGHAAITARVLTIRDVVRASTVTHDGPVHWVDDTARWWWSWTGPSGDASGTDVAHFAPDDRIERLVVVAGQVPAAET